MDNYLENEKGRTRRGFFWFICGIGIFYKEIIKQATEEAFKACKPFFAVWSKRVQHTFYGKILPEHIKLLFPNTQTIKSHAGKDHPNYIGIHPDCKEAATDFAAALNIGTPGEGDLNDDLSGTILAWGSPTSNRISRLVFVSIWGQACIVAI